MVCYIIGQFQEYLILVEFELLMNHLEEMKMKQS
ncbi:hypothetical protein T11_13161 [Trichinella zimbabwensis]|uniref:Uncharacterized protein n=1 Tax=Trichinella zimbabwensis TaxID=268475 RepID=A0A0V1GN52_9BILA|nr:hypothetical protein T11_13161 [Trichinella zimbabwensis]